MKHLRITPIVLGLFAVLPLSGCSGDDGPSGNLSLVALQIIEPDPVATGHEVRVSAEILNDGIPATQVAVSYYLSYKPDIDGGVAAPRSFDLGRS